MEKKILLYNKALVFLSVFMPLMVFPTSFIFPFIVPKIIYFRAITLLLLAGYILLFMNHPARYRIRWTPITISVLVFFASFFISTFVGVDWYRSLWDNHERMLGLFTIAHYVLYYIVLAHLYRSWEDWRQLLYAFLCAGSLVMLIGGWQYFIDREFLFNRGTNRVSATLGNAIYYSGFGLFLFYIGAFLFVQENKHWFKYGALIGSLLGLTGIFLGGTRGTIIGLVVSLLTAAVGYVLLLKQNKKMRMIVAGALAASFVVIILLISFRHTEFVRQIPGLDRLIGTTSSEIAGPRVMAWKIAIEGWQDKPFFGYGPNNYFILFNRLYQPKFLEFGIGETWFDNAHSAVFNTLAVQGILGIVSYIALFAVPILLLWRAGKKQQIDKHTVVLFGAFLLGHFVHNAFVFENPTSYLYFFFVLAFLSARLSSQPEMAAVQVRPPVGTPSKSVIVIALVVIVWLTDVNPARANHQTLLAMRDISQAANLDRARYALSIPSPHIDDIRFDLARAAASVVPGLVELKQRVLAQEMFRFGFMQMEEVLKIHPQDIRVHVQMTQLAQAGAMALQDASWFERAEQISLEAIQFSPKRQQLYYNLSAARMQQDKIDEALEAATVAIGLDPIIGESWWRKMFILANTGRKNEVRQTYRAAVEAGARFEANQIQSVESILGEKLEIDGPEESSLE